MRAERYDLDLDVDYPEGGFRGDVTLRASPLRGPVELDCEGLEIVGAWLDGVAVPFLVDAARQKLIVQAGEVEGHELRMKYNGSASHASLTGFYRSSSGGAPVLTTMMAPISCRRLLPCLDTPDQKAVFQVRVTTGSGLTVISNADLLRTEPAGDRAQWVFAPSPPMATYLLYLGIGPFETAERTEAGVRVIAATLPGKVGRTRTLLDLAGPLLRAYGEYYRQPYPLPKLHLVAVPDLWAGAMENWGAIAFPELGLLVDDGTSPAIRRWAMETLAHEIAHQWFGNLVTMATYNDLWLNESFATFVAAKMEAYLAMRSDAWSEFLVRIRPAYFGDSLQNTHPILLDITDPSAIAESTDEITYFKGASVVRMIDAYLGEEVFRRGVAAYLQRYRYGTAKGADLWDALAAESGEPVSEVLRAWVERPGLPIVRISETKGNLHLEQSGFQFADSHRTEAPWPIPLTLVLGDREVRILFRTSTSEVPWDGASPVRVNPGRSSFVRVWYDPVLRSRILQSLGGLPSAERWAFVNDTWAFLISGDAGLSEYLAVVRRGRDFTDYPSVLEVAASLDWLRPYVGDRVEVRAEAVAFYQSQAARLTLDERPGEPDTDAVVRETVLVDLVTWDDSFASQMAARFPEIDRLPAAIRPAVAQAFARTRGREAFEVLRERARSTADEDSAQTAGWALGGLPSAELLERSLAASLEPGVRASVAYFIISGVALNPLGRALTWAWLRTNLRELESRSRGSWALSRLLESTIRVVGLGREDEVEAFFAAEKFPEAANGIRKSLEVLRLGSRLRARESDPTSS